MIASTYGAWGALLAITAIQFERGLLDATSQTACWSVILFFAWPAASAAHLTVSEIFPLELRAFAIALFFMLGTPPAGVAPWLFGALIETGDPAGIAWGYYLAAVLMLGGALTAWLIGVNAKRKPLDAVTTRLSSAEFGVRVRIPKQFLLRPRTTSPTALFLDIGQGLVAEGIPASG